MPAALLVALVVAGLAASSVRADDLFTRKAQPKPERLSMAAVWDVAPHASAPDVIRFDNQWLMAFREAKSAEASGAIRVLHSLDGAKWTPMALLEHAVADLARPRLQQMPNGRLLLTAAVTMHADGPSKHRTYAWLSWDGHMWEGPQLVGDEGIYLGPIAWSRGKAFAFGHQPGTRERTLRGYMAEFDLELAPSSPASTQSAQLGSNAVAFLSDNSAVAVAEHADGSLHMAQSRPPYKHWSWQELSAPVVAGADPVKLRASDPRMLKLDDGRLLVSAADNKGRPGLYWLNAETATLTQITALAAEATGEAADLLWHDGSLWAAYRATSPAGASAIYLARIKLP